jgi:flagellar protein FlaJ
MFESKRDSSRAEYLGKLPFTDVRRSLRRAVDHIIEEKRMAADMLFMSTYMAAITTAGVTRPEIFSSTSERSEYVSSRYIGKVEHFVKRWNYSYAEGLKIVAEKTRNAPLKSLLNRYANAIDSGVPDEDFLERELETIRSVYRSTLEQGMEMLQKWGDAYVAMLFSGALVALIIMLSVALFSPGGIENTLNSSYAIIIIIAIFGLVTMYRAVPEDRKTHGLLERCSWEQAMIRRLERPVLLATVGAALLLLLVGANAGVIFILVGVMVAPLGIIGFLDDGLIVGRDKDFPTFIRSLGSVMGGKGEPVTQALADIDRKSLEAISPLIDAAYSKLNLGLNDTAVWSRFIGESGSNYIYKYMNIFRDAVALGGSPDRVGQIVHTSMLEQVLLRDKRHMIAMGFISLLIPMHAAMVAILMFLFSMMLIVSKATLSLMQTLGENQAALSSSSNLGGMASGMNMMFNFPEGPMTMYVVIIITLLTISNILAGKIVYGGDRYILYLFTAIITTVSGIIYLVAPIVVGMFFNFPTFTGV